MVILLSAMTLFNTGFLFYRYRQVDGLLTELIRSLGPVAPQSTLLPLIFEKEPLERLANDGQLAAYRHDGFWQPMDTMREKMALEALWASGKAPWKIWV